MKKKAIYFIVFALAMFTLSCSKKADVTPATTVTKFTLNGNEYIETASADSTTTTDAGTFNVLGITGFSSDNVKQASLIIVFPGSAKPKAGTYKVVGGDATIGGNQVGIIGIDKVSLSKNGLYSTTGKDNVSLTVSVSSSGKLSVSMPTIAMSGSNFDNTDPKNTVITDVNVTVSGSAIEN